MSTRMSLPLSLLPSSITLSLSLSLSLWSVGRFHVSGVGFHHSCCLRAVTIESSLTSISYQKCWTVERRRVSPLHCAPRAGIHIGCVLNFFENMNGYTGVIISFCSWVQCRLGVGKHNPRLLTLTITTATEGPGTGSAGLLFCFCCRRFLTLFSSLTFPPWMKTIVSGSYGNGTLLFLMLKWLLLL